jgi:ornithine carbamoyltransferase
MEKSLKNKFSRRSFLDLKDYQPDEIRYLLDLSKELKNAKKSGEEIPYLRGKNIALIFEKTSTRTRCAFEVAMYDQGGHVTYIDSSSSQMGHKESLKDTARVLGRFYDGIEYRGSNQSAVEELAKYAGVPVWNGLTNENHPTQILADLLTMEESSGKNLDELILCYLGDARFNMGNSLMMGGVKMGMDIRIIAPETLWPSYERVLEAQAVAATTGAKLTLHTDPFSTLKAADFLYTDVWVSMGESKSIWEERIKLLKNYQVNQELMRTTENPDVKFMHCLPAFHNMETQVGREIYEHFGLKELEVTDDVFESEASIVFDQAENRMHTIKALLVATLG